MAGQVTVWSPARLDLAVQCCRASDTAEQALAAFTARTGLTVSKHAMRTALAGSGRGSLAANLRGGLRSAVIPAAVSVTVAHRAEDDRVTPVPSSGPEEIEIPIELDVEPEPVRVDAPRDPDPIERQEARDRATRDARTIKTLVERVREAEGRQAFLDQIGCHREPPHIMPRERTSGLREMTAVAALSDCHVEETVEPESIAYRNEYNLDIADARLTRFFNGVAWNIEHHRASKHLAIRDLVLWLGGDLMTGYIHEELQESNALSPTQTMLWLLPRIRNGIATLLDRLGLDQITIPCSHGNHGRTTAKPRISTAYKNSFEWLLYNQLASEFRDEKRIRFEITGSAHQYVKVYDFMLHFHHGDSLKYQGGVGGLSVPLLRAVPSWDLVCKADYHHIGHWHQLRDYGRALVNGSLIGFGPYSQWIRAEYEEPKQLFYLLDKTRGKCQVTPVWVGEEAEARRAVA